MGASRQLLSSNESYKSSSTMEEYLPSGMKVYKVSLS
jgi:hypothetical protein